MELLCTGAARVLRTVRYSVKLESVPWLWCDGGARQLYVAISSFPGESYSTCCGGGDRAVILVICGKLGRGCFLCWSSVGLMSDRVLDLIDWLIDDDDGSWAGLWDCVGQRCVCCYSLIGCRCSSFSKMDLVRWRIGWREGHFECYLLPSFLREL